MLFVLVKLSRLPVSVDYFMLFSFRKENLHYRWTIEDVEMVLVEMRTNLESPKLNIPGVDSNFNFTVSLASCDDSYCSLFRSSGKMNYGSKWTKSQVSQVPSRHRLSFHIHFTGNVRWNNVWVMSSSFSLFNPLTGSTVTSKQLNKLKINDMNWPTEFYTCSTLKSILHDGALTFQIAATVLLLDSRVESIVQIPPVVGFGEKMKQMYERNLFTDVRIVVQNKMFNVHRAVLASHSPAFEKMFENDTKEKLERKIEIVDLDSDVVEDLVEFMY